MCAALAQPPCGPRESRLSVWLFHGVAVFAFVALAVPVVLYVYTQPFSRKTLGLVLFAAAWGERAWAMYLRQGLGRAVRAAGRDWTATAVGYAYALTVGLAAVEYLLRGHPCGGWTAWSGAWLYLAGVALRYWSFRALREQWQVDVSNTAGDRCLVQHGPYRYLRHPIYVGACAEALGMPLLLGAPLALAVSILVFVPLEIVRARLEERYLRQTFGEAYTRFTADTPGWWPRMFRRR